MARHSLQMHKELLTSVIKQQAGSFDKSVLELNMNAIEAGSKRVDNKFFVEDGKAYFEVTDDGKGITSKEEIEKFFATFGTPHSKSENKIWAKFRMGRGQAFSYGKNVWRTATFKMTVDINNWGLEYDLEENLPFMQGCHISIELYENPLKYQYTSVEKLAECIQKQIEFMDTPVYFNGQKISTNPKDLKWTQEDENAYYLFGVGTNLAIYNLGAFVRTRETYDIGVCGIVVSKKQLEVNFARNDIMSTCPVWREILYVVRDNKAKKVRKEHNRLSYQEKQSIISDIRDGAQEWDTVKNISLISTSQRKMLSPYQILSMKSKWTFAESGNRQADKLMERGSTICIDSSILNVLRYRGREAEFFTWLFGETYANDFISYRREEAYNNLKRIEQLYSPLDKLVEKMDSRYELISYDKWTLVEKRILKTLQNMHTWGGRTLLIGASGCAQAWTDGSSYIALERTWLSDKRYFSWDTEISDLFAVLTHELAHDADTAQTHIHSPEYYENFYQIVMDKSESPMANIAKFRSRLDRMKIEQIQQKEIEKQERAIRKRNKVLGLKEVAANNV